MSPNLPPLNRFDLTDFELHCGTVLPHAQLAYRTYGTLNADRSNAILYPTSYGVVDADVAWLIGKNRILDPERYFIIAVNMLGNGASTSPSTLWDSFPDGNFPRISHVDNIAIQHRMIRETFGIERLALVYGWSMGAQQAYHWGALLPDHVARIFAICGTAKTSIHNWVFLDGLRAALKADPAWDGTRFTERPERGLRAFGRIYAGWALSQGFYRNRLFEDLGHETVESYLTAAWEPNFLHRDPHNLLSLIDTWQRCDISDNAHFGGDLSAALKAIRCPAVAMASTTDLYFRAHDIRAEAAAMTRATYAELDTLWGHRGGNPEFSSEDEAVVRASVRQLLAS